MAQKKKKAPKKGEAGYKPPNKYTTGKVMGWAGLAAPAAYQGYKYAVTGEERNLEALSKIYFGYDMENEDFRPQQLIRGWAGTANDRFYRKFCRFIGIRPYPSINSKSPMAIMDNVAFHLPVLWQAAENDDPVEFATEAYRGYFGVDLSTSDAMAAYDPEAMIYTRSPYVVFQAAKKLARQFHLM